MVAITGHSGIGKSTLLNIIGCLDTASSGQYLFEGQDMTTMSNRALSVIRRENFGYIFQQYWLIKHLTVLENVELSLRYRNTKPRHCQSLAIQTLSELGLEKHLHHRPMELSGGQQQRACIARAIITQPKVLLADEPTGALDHQSSFEIMRILREFNTRSHTTIMVVTHDRDIAKYCQRITDMSKLFTHTKHHHVSH